MRYVLDSMQCNKKHFYRSHAVCWRSEQDVLLEKNSLGFPTVEFQCLGYEPKQ